MSSSNFGADQTLKLSLALVMRQVGGLRFGFRDGFRVKRGVIVVTNILDPSRVSSRAREIPWRFNYWVEVKPRVMLKEIWNLELRFMNVMFEDTFE